MSPSHSLALNVSGDLAGTDLLGRCVCVCVRERERITRVRTFPIHKPRLVLLVAARGLVAHTGAMLAGNKSTVTVKVKAQSRGPSLVSCYLEVIVLCCCFCCLLRTRPSSEMPSFLYHAWIIDSSEFQGSCCRRGSCCWCCCWAQPPCLLSRTEGSSV